MPGKFSQLETWNHESSFTGVIKAIPAGAPSFAVTPVGLAQVMRLGEDGKRELATMQWAFAKPRAMRFEPHHMHARCETIDSKPRFCDAFGERRGILIVETFNEGEKLPNGKTRQWVIRPRDRKPIAIAVIWEEWKGSDRSALTFCMITTPANGVISRAEERMPAILRQEDWPVWLGERDAKLSEVKALLRTFDDEGNWEMSEQSAAKQPKPPPPKTQMDLF
jgi:putative SOS response-associated peptidase YedK